MAKWIDIGPVSELARDEKQCLEVQGFSVVLMRAKGEWRAIANVCPHAGMPLGEGDVCGNTIVCPFHGYTYDIVTGRNVDDPYDLPVMVYALREADGRLEVKLPIADAADGNDECRNANVERMTNEE